MNLGPKHFLEGGDWNIFHKCCMTLWFSFSSDPLVYMYAEYDYSAYAYITSQKYFTIFCKKNGWIYLHFFRFSSVCKKKKNTQPKQEIIRDNKVEKVQRVDISGTCFHPHSLYPFLYLPVQKRGSKLRDGWAERVARFPKVNQVWLLLYLRSKNKRAISTCRTVGVEALIWTRKRE